MRLNYLSFLIFFLIFFSYQKTVLTASHAKENAGKCIKGDCVNGKGIFDDGVRLYEGEFKDGIYHGQGSSKRHDNGTTYEGEWKYNKPNGQGTLITKKGSKYVGEWKDNKRNGQGTQTSASGKKFVGVFKDNKRHGKGTITWPDGSYFAGVFKDNKAHGKGKFLQLRNKLIKYGNYKNGKLNGKAIVISKAPSISSLGLEKGDLRNNYQDNGYFIKNGDHLNGKLHGRAEAYTALVYHAFREGEQVARPARDISKIQPEYLDTYIIKKLSSFEGDWKNGEEDGYGTHTWSNGTKIYGQYKDGKKVGQHKKLTVKRSNQNSTNTSSQSIKNERSSAARFIGDALKCYNSLDKNLKKTSIVNNLSDARKFFNKGEQFASSNPAMASNFYSIASNNAKIVLKFC